MAELFRGGRRSGVAWDWEDNPGFGHRGQRGGCGWSSEDRTLGRGSRELSVFSPIGSLLMAGWQELYLSSEIIRLKAALTSKSRRKSLVSGRTCFGETRKVLQAEPRCSLLSHCSGHGRLDRHWLGRQQKMGLSWYIRRILHFGSHYCSA